MKKKPSWQLSENYFIPLPDRLQKFNDVIYTSLEYKHTLNESDLFEVINLLEEARLHGWYPFVSEISMNYNNTQLFDYIYKMKKDEIIFEFLLLEHEVDILSEFSDVDIESFKERIQKLKGQL